jgi:hypothetical protein
MKTLSWLAPYIGRRYAVLTGERWNLVYAIHETTEYRLTDTVIFDIILTDTDVSTKELK